jgi:hypothetical protein
LHWSNVPASHGCCQLCWAVVLPRIWQLPT